MKFTLTCVLLCAACKDGSNPLSKMSGGGDLGTPATTTTSPATPVDHPDAGDVGTVTEIEGGTVSGGIIGPADAGPDPNDPANKRPSTNPSGSSSSVACTYPRRAFDISTLEPTSPPSLVTAWRMERANSKVPGLVIEFQDLISGPVHSTIGSVHTLTAVVFAFDGLPLSASGFDVTPTIASGMVNLKFDSGETGFVVSFGDEKGRRGFSVNKVAVDVTTNFVCGAIAAGSVVLSVPAANADQPFGTGTVADAFGPALPDGGWQITLGGTTSSIVNINQ